METPSQIISEILPPQQAILSPIQGPGSADDFSDLDELLADSVAMVKKAVNRRIYKETKKIVEDMAAQQKLVAWDVLENIEVWQMTKCKCGGLGTMTFVRSMQKLRKVGYDVLHWETVKELPAGAEKRFALVERDVERCEFCAQLEYEKFTAFGEVVGCQKGK